MRAHSITTPPGTGVAPPERPVPAPRGTYGTPAALHARTIPATASVVVGQHDACAVPRSSVSPSDS